VKIVFSVFMLLVFATTAHATTYKGVDFPQGDVSFADQVVSFTPGPNTIAPYNNPDAALGVPDEPTGNYYVSLGWGGTLILKFTDNSLTTSGNSDKDLWVFEIGPAVEPTYVSISKDGSNWISVGEVGGSISGVDIDAYIGSGVVLWDQYSYVKLVDKNLHLSGSPYAGADIDALGAISSAAPVVEAVPVPASILLLGTGLAGLVAWRKKQQR